LVHFDAGAAKMRAGVTPSVIVTEIVHPCEQPQRPVHVSGLESDSRGAKTLAAMVPS